MAPRKRAEASRLAFVQSAGEEPRLLAEHLKALKLPAFLREYDALARQCIAEGLDHSRFLLRLAELELAERHARRVERLIRQARFPALKSLEEFDFAAIPSLDKRLVLELAECDYIARHENVVAVGGIGTGKTHLALGLGLAACRKGLSVGFTTAASLAQELIEARSERRFMRLQRQLDACRLLIIDELSYAPLPTVGAELLFEIVSRRCERGSIIITSNLPMSEWVGIFGSERLTQALRSRLSYHLRIIEMNSGRDPVEQWQRQPPPLPAAATFASHEFMRLAVDRDRP